ncbi:hypothetical protein CCR98_07875 [Stenotrophomonas sp. WZN-1]|nr:hypothetical protein CCR98_07875 [Stenotrophomonas sp. WZN-1]
MPPEFAQGNSVIRTNCICCYVVQFLTERRHRLTNLVRTLSLHNLSAKRLVFLTCQHARIVKLSDNVIKLVRNYPCVVLGEAPACRIVDCGKPFKRTSPDRYIIPVVYILKLARQIATSASHHIIRELRRISPECAAHCPVECTLLPRRGFSSP